METLFVLFGIAVICLFLPLLAAGRPFVRMTEEQEEYFDILILKKNRYVVDHARVSGMDNILQLKEIVRYKKAWRRLGLSLTPDEAAELWIAGHAAEWRRHHAVKATGPHYEE
jgi:hypothetical protein